MHVSIQAPIASQRSTTPMPAGWRARLAVWLYALARHVAGSTVEANDRPPKARAPIEVHPRPDVATWLTTLGPEALNVLCPQPNLRDALVRVANQLKYLPDQSTLMEFNQRVPDWPELHKRFAAYLLRRLVCLRHQGRAADVTFPVVHAWLRSRSLLTTPIRWEEAVAAAEIGLGEEAGVHLVRSPRGSAAGLGA